MDLRSGATENGASPKHHVLCMHLIGSMPCLQAIDLRVWNAKKAALQDMLKAVFKLPMPVSVEVGAPDTDVVSVAQNYHKDLQPGGSAQQSLRQLIVNYAWLEDAYHTYEVMAGVQMLLKVT